MNIALWAEALRVIPRVDKDQWAKIDPIAKWLIATRSAVFIMTAFSAIVGGILAFGADKFDAGRFALATLGLILAHATNNLLNDYTDYVRGVDKDNYFRTLYGPQVVENGLWSKAQLLKVTAATGLLAVWCGISLIFIVGPEILWPMLAGAFFVLFYTWPLKNIGLGEPAVLLVWGPLMVGGTYLAITGDWSWSVALIGAIYAIGPTTVLFGKHTDKLKEDAKKKVNTLPVILGERNSRYAVIVMMYLQIILTILAVATGLLEWPMLLIILGLPSIWSATKIFSKPRPLTKPADAPDMIWPTYLVAYAFRSNRVTGGLFVLGLVASQLI